jgi:hypothetical protein
VTSQAWPPIDHRPGFSLPALLFWAAILSTLPVLWLNVLPVLGGGGQRGHADQSLWIVLHALTGLITLISGFLALYMGWTRRAFEYHRHTGCTYVGAGMTMAFVALFLAISDPGRSHADGWATGTLAAVWLVATSMGWWRGSQKRWRSHQSWMIRSMVLTWTFVLLRLAQRLEDLEGLAPALGIWLYWVGPLLIAEIGLQIWNRRQPAA